MNNTIESNIRRSAFLSWLFLTKDGEIVIYQKPNMPLIIGLLFIFLALIFGHPYSNVFRTVGDISLFIWSLLEIYSGVNGFRKILGFVILIGLIGWFLR